MTLKELKELLIIFHDWSCSGDACIAVADHPWHSSYDKKREDVSQLKQFIDKLNQASDDNNEEFSFEWAKTLPNTEASDSLIMIQKNGEDPRVIVYTNPAQISIYNNTNRTNNAKNISCSDIRGLIKTRGDFRWILRKLEELE